jgi:ABC-type transporter lipoprotein component MlaA
MEGAVDDRYQSFRDAYITQRNALVEDGQGNADDPLKFNEDQFAPVNQMNR